MKTEQIVALCLKDLGITHVYGIGAVPVHEMFQHCAAIGLSVIGAREQRAAVFMAACHNYLAGQQRACVITSTGPGVTNLMTGMLVARDNQWPVLVIANCVSRDSFAAGAFQAYDSNGAMQTLARYVCSVDCPEILPQTLQQAILTNDTGPRAPAFVEIPTSVLKSTATVVPALSSTPLPAEPIPEGIVDQLIQKLSAAHRPLLLIGHEVRWNDGYQHVKKVISRADMAFATTPLARGLVPGSDTHCVTRAAGRAQAEADLVIMAGCTLDWIFRFGAMIDKSATVIQLGEHSKTPQRCSVDFEVIPGECHSLLKKIADDLETSYPDCATRRESNWIDTLHQAHCTSRLDLVELHGTTDDTITPYFLALAASRAANQDTLFILDANVTMRAADLMLEPEKFLTHLTAGQDGCMGCGVPFAIASLLESIDRQVIVICGDFALGQSIMELETASRLNLPLVVLLANNDAASGAIYESPEYRSGFSRFVPDLRYDHVAVALGASGEYVDNPHLLENAITAAMNTARRQSKPYLLNVKVSDQISMPPRL